MRKPVLLIFFNACILIVVFALLAQSLFVVQRVALVRSASGQVQVQRGGAGVFTPLFSGGSVKTGDVVTTGTRSEAEFAWRDGTRWKLAPGSVFSIEEAALNPAKKNEISRFRLEKGQVLMRVVKPMASTSRFEIETPHAIASVRGTVFSVGLQNLETQVKVYSGRVDVINLGGTQKVSLTPQQQATVSLLDFKTRTNTDQSEFLAQPSFLRPELQARAEILSNETVLLRGQTEVGDRLTINGVQVPVLGTGVFVKKVKNGAPGSRWKIESTDVHGAKTSIWQALPAAAYPGNPYPK